MGTNERLIPRTLWLLWYQGIAEAPLVVKRCVDSWVLHNSTWDIRILDAGNIHEHVDPDLPQDVAASRLSPNHRSDLLRLALLSRYGGVWADATTFCRRPLEDWLDNCTHSGFFVFHKPGRDRILSSWFIASVPGSALVCRLHERFRSYWVDNHFPSPNRVRRAVVTLLSAVLNRSDRTTRFWFSPPVTQMLKVYPYFAFHYLFERIVATDEQCAAIWRDTPRVSADPSHLIHQLGFFSYPSESLRKRIDDSTAPLFKLAWAFDQSKYAAGTLLHYVLEGDKLPLAER